MAFVAEDGSGLPLANSLASVAAADAYFLEVGNAVWAALIPTQKQQNLVKATRYFMQRYSLYGKRKLATQGTSYPRTGIYDSFGTELVDIVPVNIIYGISELAFIVQTEPLFFTPALPSGAGGEIISTKRKVGPIERETKYASKSEETVIEVNRLLPNAETWFRGFIINESYLSGRVFR